jgi:DNA-directed RNA polymerase subunit alpha
MIATAGDIEVTNPDLLICHLDEGATLNMELMVDIGKGYQPAAANRPADAPIGLIPVDALYSPVRPLAAQQSPGLPHGCAPTRSRTPASARSSTTTS